MMEWRAVWRGVRSAEKQLSALLESGVPTAAKELTTHSLGEAGQVGEEGVGVRLCGHSSYFMEEAPHGGGAWGGN